MKKRIVLCLTLLFLLSALPMQALAAESGSCGAGISWTFDGSTLTISGSGAMDDCSGGAPWETFKGSIRSVVFTGGVTYVGAGAFKDCDALTSVSLGSSMTELGAEAFAFCDGLTSLSTPASFKIFGPGSLQSCPNLKRIDCAGRFPTFRSNCLWQTRATIYYPAASPWPVDTIKQLESAFNGRVEFLASDGTDPVKPTEPEPTEPPTTAPPTEAPTEGTTAPAESITTPPETAPPIEIPTRAPAPTPQREVQDDSNTTLWLILLLLISVGAAAAAVIIHSQQVKRRRRKARRRRTSR